LFQRKLSIQAMQPSSILSIDRAPSPASEAALASLLEAVLVRNPFYRNKLRGHPLASDPAHFSSLPFTLKSELVEDQALNPPFGSNLTFPRDRYTRLCHTSGTSGAPLYWLDTEESWSWMCGNWLHVFAAAGVAASDSIFFAFSFGPFLGFWTAFEAAAKLGALAIPGGGLTSVARLQKLIELEAAVLCCTPSYALRLALIARESGIDLARSRVSRIIVAGECGGSVGATRDRIEQLWNGARVVDHYGMTEAGPAGYSCPSRPGVLHILESSYIAEVVEPGTGSPVPSGAPGELVLTPLGRIGSPVLRYKTGDLVKACPSGPCACGAADLALAGGILGRFDDMLVIKGVNIYPAAVERILFDRGVIEYRVHVSERQGMPELSIQVEGSDKDFGGGLEEHVHSALGIRVALSYVSPGALHSSDGKAKKWVRHPIA
jgi:phenylacetate-CoA ligase